MGAAGNLEGGLCSSRSLALGFSIATHCRAMQARDTPEHTGDEEQDSDKKKARSHTPQTPALQSSQFQTQHSSAPFGAPACIVSPPPA